MFVLAGGPHRQCLVPLQARSSQWTKSGAQVGAAESHLTAQSGEGDSQAPIQPGWGRRLGLAPTWPCREEERGHDPANPAVLGEGAWPQGWERGMVQL